MLPRVAAAVERSDIQGMMGEMDGIWSRFERLKDRMNRAGIPGNAPVVRAYANATSSLAILEEALKSLETTTIK